MMTALIHDTDQLKLIRSDDARCTAAAAVLRKWLWACAQHTQHSTSRFDLNARPKR